MQLLNERQSLIASYLVIGTALIAILPLGLLVGLLAGLLVFALVTHLSPYVERFADQRYSRIAVVVILSMAIISLLVLIVLSMSAYVVHDLKDGGLAIITRNMDALLQKFQLEFGHYFPGFIPESIDDIKSYIIDWLKQHATALQHAGTDILHAFVTMLIGMVLGALISLSPPTANENSPYFRRFIMIRLHNIYTSFTNVVFAQIKISLINTVLTGLFIFIVMPLLGMSLPFGKTLVILTFVFGLLPVVGNLISNTLVVSSAISVSFVAALISLAFLIVIHKLEYFLNADIVGKHINAKAWELLVAMLVLQAMFGLTGLVAAPIYYAYFKTEMKAAKLI